MFTINSIRKLILNRVDIIIEKLESKNNARVIKNNNVFVIVADIALTTIAIFLLSIIL